MIFAPPGDPTTPARRRRRALLGLGALAAWAVALAFGGGCAELATARGPVPPPPGLLASADPGREAIAELAETFRGGGASLTGRPERTARAAALLEWLSADLVANARWQPVDGGVRERVGAAREEMRGAVGVLAGIPSSDAAASLAAASRALVARDERGAAAALDARRFRQGGARTLERLSDPGALPVGEIALGALATEVARLDASGGWVSPQAVRDPSTTGTRALLPGY